MKEMPLWGFVPKLLQRFLRLPWLSMTPRGTGAQGMHVLNRVKPTSCHADKSPMQRVARSSTSISGSDSDPAMLVPTQVSPFLPHRRSKCSHGIQTMSQVKPLQAKEESRHSQHGSRGWTAYSPSHSLHRIPLPNTQHGGLALWQWGQNWCQAFQKVILNAVWYALSAGNQILQKPWSHIHLLLMHPVELHCFFISTLFRNFCVKPLGRISWQKAVPKLQKQG